MKILLELSDSKESTCEGYEQLLVEELERLLVPNGFIMKQIAVSSTTNKRAPPSGEALVARDGLI